MRHIDLQILFDDDDKDTAQVFVEGRLGKESCRFLLDTGCATTTLMWNQQTSGMASLGKKSSSGVFGRAEYDLVLVESLEVGPLLQRRPTISRAKAGGTDRHLLGMDFLRDHALTFDFTAKRVDVISGMEEPLDLTMDSGGIPYVDVHFASGGAKAVWDTGAGITLVNSQFIAKHPAQFGKIGSSVGTDSTGAKNETPTYLMKPVMIGGLLFGAHKTVGVDLSHVNQNIEMPMDMILGYTTLKQARWLFDFPGRKWAAKSY